MKKPVIDPAKYKKLLKLAKASGSKDMIGTILGSLDPAVTEAYLDHLKTTNPDDVPAGWAVEDGEDDDLDEFGLDDDEPEEDTQAKLTKAVKAVQKTAESVSAGLNKQADAWDGVAQKQMAKVKKAADEYDESIREMVTLPTGTVYPEKFRLRAEDGSTIDLECFSKGKFGFLLRIPVPTDMRTVNVKGKDLTVDYLALQRDPDGTTEGVSNRKLAALIELDL